MTESVKMDLEIPDDLQNELDELFPASEERRKIASILMFWDKKPTTKEQNQIGEAVGRKRSTVNEVIVKLIDKAYFSKDLGSMPLWRHTNKKAGLSLTSTHVERVSPTDPPTDDPDPSEEEFEEVPDEDSDETGRFVGPLPGVGKDFDDRLTAQQQELDGLKRIMNTRFDELAEVVTRDRTHALSVDPPEPEAVEPVNPVPVEAVEEEGPFAGMSKKAVIDLAVNDPEALYAMRHGYMRSSETIMAMPETMRWMGVMMTTYTQNAFERSVSDGYEGSFSDFLNDCVYQYFADRGKVLQWADMPTPGKMPYPERRLRGG